MVRNYECHIVHQRLDREGSSKGSIGQAVAPSFSLARTDHSVMPKSKPITSGWTRSGYSDKIQIDHETAVQMKTRSKSGQLTHHLIQLTVSITYLPAYAGVSSCAILKPRKERLTSNKKRVKTKLLPQAASHLHLYAKLQFIFALICTGC